MKIAVFSDSHGETRYMREVIEKTEPEMAIHLGDGVRDTYRLQELFPRLLIERVKGNCDLACDEESVKKFTISGKKFILTHGHIYKVKHGTEEAIRAAESENADILLFGHTHRALYQYRNGLHILNPGTVSGRGEATFGMIVLENSGIFCYYQKL